MLVGFMLVFSMSGFYRFCLQFSISVSSNKCESSLAIIYFIKSFYTSLNSMDSRSSSDGFWIFVGLSLFLHDRHVSILKQAFLLRIRSSGQMMSSAAAAVLNSTFSTSLWLPTKPPYVCHTPEHIHPAIPLFRILGHFVRLVLEVILLTLSSPGFGPRSMLNRYTSTHH